MTITTHSKRIVDIPHNCGLIGLRFFDRETSESEFIYAFNSLCEDWPYGGVKDTEMFKVMDYLKLSKNFKWVNCANKNIKIRNLLDYKKYLVLIKGHYLVITHNKVINGGYCSDNTQVIGYWEWVENNQKEIKSSNFIICFIKSLWDKLFCR